MKRSSIDFGSENNFEEQKENFKKKAGKHKFDSLLNRTQKH